MVADNPESFSPPNTGRRSFPGPDAHLERLDGDSARIRESLASKGFLRTRLETADSSRVTALTGEHTCSDFGNHRFGYALTDHSPSLLLQVTTSSDFGQEGPDLAFEQLMVKLPAIRAKQNLRGQDLLPPLSYEMSRQFPLEAALFEVGLLATVSAGCPEMRLEKLPINLVQAGFRGNGVSRPTERLSDREAKISARWTSSPMVEQMSTRARDDHGSAVALRMFTLISERLASRGKLSDEAVSEWWGASDGSSRSRASKLSFPMDLETVDGFLRDTRMTLLQIERGREIARPNGDGLSLS